MCSVQRRRRQVLLRLSRLAQRRPSSHSLRPPSSLCARSSPRSRRSLSRRHSWTHCQLQRLQQKRPLCRGRRLSGPQSLQRPPRQQQHEQQHQRCLPSSRHRRRRQVIHWAPRPAQHPRHLYLQRSSTPRTARRHLQTPRVVPQQLALAWGRWAAAQEEAARLTRALLWAPAPAAAASPTGGRWGPWAERFDLCTYQADLTAKFVSPLGRQALADARPAVGTCSGSRAGTPGVSAALAQRSGAPYLGVAVACGSIM